MDVLIDSEISRYKSKKPSSVSKASVRSKHKHQYKPCKLTYSDTYAIPGKDTRTYNFTDTANYCIICGKINNRKMMWRDTSILEDDTIPTFKVSGYDDKFIDIVD